MMKKSFFRRISRPLRLMAGAVVLLTGVARGGAEVTDFSEIEKVAIEADSRSKPFYVFATETMQALTGRATYKEDGKKTPAMAAVLDIGLHAHVWAERPLVLIDYKPLKETLGLSPSQKLFSLKELAGNEKLLELAAEVETLRGTEGSSLDRQQKEVESVVERLRLAQQLMSGNSFRFFPPPTDTDWLAAGHLGHAYPGEKGAAAVAVWEELTQAFLKGDETTFAAASRKLGETTRALNPAVYPTESILALETRYAKSHPFRWAWIAYALAAIILGLTSLKGRKGGYQLAWALILIGFALQIFGFGARVIVAGRAPVTNMYETVVWMAFGTILFAIILEAIYKSRLIFAAAAPVAVVALILADTQTTILASPIKPLEAVLNNNFWLATHVTCITLSYAAFALALGVGHIILVKVLLRRDVTSGLYNYLYRSIQIGVLLLAIGIILGGVWANVSWGRFWDWDPKETWALIALLGYLALLHGRIAGWWKGFGLAVGAILAFQSVVMAWYGVNFVLGEGLHSYGFGTGGFPAMMGYVAIEVAFVILVILRRPVAKGGSERLKKAAV